MKLFSRRERIPTEDLKTPPPERGAKRFFFLLGNHFGKLVSANLLFVLFSLPVLTIPGSLTALNRVCVKLAREGNCYVWEEFWEEFKGSVFKSLPVGIGTGLCLFSAWYSITMGMANGGAVRILFMAVGLMLLMLVLPMASSAFVLMAMVDLPMKALIKDALALVFLSLGRSLGVLMTLAVSWGLLALFFPLTVLSHGLVLAAVTQLILCLILMPLVVKYIVEPYERAQAEADEGDAAAEGPDPAV